MSVIYMSFLLLDDEIESQQSQSVVDPREQQMDLHKNKSNFSAIFCVAYWGDLDHEVSFHLLQDASASFSKPDKNEVAHMSKNCKGKINSALKTIIFKPKRK